VPTFSPTFVLEHDYFKSRLKQRAFGWAVIVFFAYDQDDLTMALSFKEFMVGIRLIIVLHKINARMVQLGLSLSPCFMTCAKSDFSDIIAVLEKILVLKSRK
jgi:hypothetical protein